MIDGLRDLLHKSQSCCCVYKLPLLCAFLLILTFFFHLFVLHLHVQGATEIARGITDAKASGVVRGIFGNCGWVKYGLGGSFVVPNGRHQIVDDSKLDLFVVDVAYVDVYHVFHYVHSGISRKKEAWRL